MKRRTHPAEEDTTATAERANDRSEGSPAATARPSAPEAPSEASTRRRKWLVRMLPLVALAALMGWYAATDWRLFRRSFEAPRWGYCNERMTPALLDESVRIGSQYLLRHQRPEGNFDYEFDWVRKELSSQDRQVRQAGALWALALLHRQSPTDELREAIVRGVSFYDAHSVEGADEARCVAYPGESQGLTGTVAVAALAILDGMPEQARRMRQQQTAVHRQLDGYLKQLIRSRTPMGVWFCCYDLQSCQPHGTHSPYSDGEALLALVKATKLLEIEDLQPFVRQAAADGYRINVREALAQDADSDLTKGYYQWSTMAFYELYTSGWENTDEYGDWVLELADWMIDVHNPLSRSRNTAYSIEGIAHAYDVATRRGDRARQQKYRCVIDTVLEQLSSWQVGNPIANAFIRKHADGDPRAVGGVQNEPSNPTIRIDVTQHQVHALLLARRFLHGP